ncbi:MAG: hypothetical protein IJP90_16365 [Treponema sp.]|nr:hypothetical protein [Treponema sp.]
MGNNIKYKFAKKGCGYDTLHPIFCFAHFTHTSYFTEKNAKEDVCSLYSFFTALQKISLLTWRDIKTKPRMFHFHEIPGDKPIYNEMKIKEDTLLIQMKLTGDRESRIVGFFDEKNIFNIVAYDYNHKIYPDN